jgi:hypothetical protein
VITYLDGVADPGVLRKAAATVGCFHDDVRPESADLETALRVELAELIECRRPVLLRGGGPATA